mmetsp:Transcript_26584/g.76616  ORF Transcript_26584/g.76616 Transcript_26584/m.76616 type:complete len:208 (+) Transcript_26584:887-1510(+)
MRDFMQVCGQLRAGGVRWDGDGLLRTLGVKLVNKVAGHGDVLGRAKEPQFTTATLNVHTAAGHVLETSNTCLRSDLCHTCSHELCPDSCRHLLAGSSEGVQLPVRSLDGFFCAGNLEEAARLVELHPHLAGGLDVAQAAAAAPAQGAQQLRLKAHLLRDRAWRQRRRRGALVVIARILRCTPESAVEHHRGTDQRTRVAKGAASSRA